MRPRCKLFILLLLMSVVPGSFGARLVPVEAPRAMVASVRASASRIGVQIMKAGGNAVDAAVAVGFALAVVHPQDGKLGGAGLSVFRIAGPPAPFYAYTET